MVKTVYLDINYWIDLKKAEYGEIKDKDITKSLNAVKKSIENGDTIYPISTLHILEVSSRADEKSRTELLDFLIKISKGYAIIPYVSILRYEVKYATLKLINKHITHPKKFVIGYGMPYIIGAKPEVISKNKNKELPSELKSKLEEMTYSLRAFVISVKNPNVLNYLKSHRKNEKLLAEKIEAEIDHDNKFQDIDFRRRYSITRFFIEMILPKMAIEAAVSGHRKEDFMQKPSREWIENFFQSMPTLYCDWALSFARNQERSKKIKIDPNDSNDIASLSIAIPYCDIVATDKKWQSIICYKEELNKLYNTQMVFSIKELWKYI